MKIVIISVGGITEVILGNLFLKVPQAAIEIAAESIGLGPVSNALLTSFILSLITIIVAFFLGRNLQERPKGLQNIVEALINNTQPFINNNSPFFNVDPLVIICEGQTTCYSNIAFDVDGD